MKRTILTPERKAVREAQESKWFSGYAGGRQVVALPREALAEQGAQRQDSL